MATVDDLDVNSPRTLEACLHKGLLVDELLPRKARSFGAPDMSKEVAERRYEFFEKRRLDKITMVKALFAVIEVFFAFSALRASAMSLLSAQTGRRCVICC